MRREVSSGILLFASCLAVVLVMGLHPTGHELMDTEAFERLARLNKGIHGVAIAALPTLFVGLLGLWRRLSPSELSTAALVAFGLGVVAGVSAAVASGFVAPVFIERALEAGEGRDGPNHALLTFAGALNQGFAAVYVVATSAAILLWSLSMLRTGRMGRSVASAGIAVGAVFLLLLLAGHLHLGVHGFGMVVFAQSAWLIWIGVLLCRGSSAGAAS